MDVVEPETGRPRMIARIARLLTRPARTWDEIAAETTTPRELLLRWVAPLAAIPAVCMTLGQFFPQAMLDLRYKTPVAVVLVEGVASYLLYFAQVFLLAVAIDLLAPLFGGARDRLKALKLAAYSATPLWLFGVALLLSSVGGLLMLLGGMYGLYLLLLGLPRLMKSAPERSLTYFALLLITAIMLGVVGGAIMNHVRELGGPVSIQVVGPQH